MHPTTQASFKPRQLSFFLFLGSLVQMNANDAAENTFKKSFKQTAAQKSYFDQYRTSSHRTQKGNDKNALWIVCILAALRTSKAYTWL